MAGTSRTLTSKVECQQRCRDKFGCNYFGWYPVDHGSSGYCHLSTGSLGGIANNHFYSGDRYCDNSSYESIPSIAPRDFRAFRSGVDSSLCMDVSGSQAHNGNAIQLWTCNNSDAQMWFMDPEGRIRSKLNVNKCVEPGVDVALHAKLTIWDCNANNSQKFEAVGEKIRSKKNGRFIGVWAWWWCGVYEGRAVEMQNELTSTDNCEEQQVRNEMFQHALK